MWTPEIPIVGHAGVFGVLDRRLGSGGRCVQSRARMATRVRHEAGFTWVVLQSVSHRGGRACEGWRLPSRVRRSRRP